MTPLPNDWRHISNGREIPTEFYSDQPYIVRTDDAAWLCTVTTGAGHEGVAGQHVVSCRSTDAGRTWSEPVPLEPGVGPEASYAVLLKVPGGRIYCFYNHNTDNVREVPGDSPPYKDGICRRVDSLGYYVFRYSDDHGRSWSAKRYTIPVREMQIDRQNALGGAVRFFWNVGKPFIHEAAALVPLIKVGGFGHGFFTRTEGVLLKSANILSENDPENIEWETLPDGDYGLRAPEGGGAIAEEQSYCVLSDGSVYAVYRTVDGHPACTYSRDGGHTWSAPRYQCFADGRAMKHPRAANFAWRCANGKYLYWFHNHGGRDYDDRNPVWLCGGEEIDSPEGKLLRWSQPEIALYDDDPYIRMSYPDLVEEEGVLYLTETQKNIARVHAIDPTMLDGLWNQFDHAQIASEGLVLSVSSENGIMPAQIEMPPLPVFSHRDYARADYGNYDTRAGFTLELWLRLDELSPGQTLLDSRGPDGKGLWLRLSERETLEIVLHDGRTENRWDCDRGALVVGKRQHIGIIVDGGPKLILFVVDGRLCDGGTQRQFGWGRFSPNLYDANGSAVAQLGPSLNGEIESLRIYDRALRVSELVVQSRRMNPRR